MYHKILRKYSYPLGWSIHCPVLRSKSETIQPLTHNLLKICQTARRKNMTKLLKLYLKQANIYLTTTVPSKLELYFYNNSIQFISLLLIINKSKEKARTNI